MEKTHIKTHIENFLKAIPVSFELVESVESNDSVHPLFLVTTTEADKLIGPNGDHLSALNYLLRRIVAKSIGSEQEIKFVVDVNGYYEEKTKHIKAKARILCERARSLKTDIECEPMTSYERMLVHSFLEHELEIKTESRGEGKNRHVVIRYVPI